MNEDWHRRPSQIFNEVEKTFFAAGDLPPADQSAPLLIDPPVQRRRWEPGRWVAAALGGALFIALALFATSGINPSGPLPVVVIPPVGAAPSTPGAPISPPAPMDAIPEPVAHVRAPAAAKAKPSVRKTKDGRARHRRARHR